MNPYISIEKESKLMNTSLETNEKQNINHGSIKLSWVLNLKL